MEIPRDSIPKSTVVPDGIYHLTCDEFKIGQSRSEKLQYTVTFRIVAPEAVAGLTLTDYLTVGQDADPQAQLPETWTNVRNISAKQLRQLLDGTQCQSNNDEQIQHELPGKQCLAYVIRETQEEGQYAGSESNRIRRYFKLGEREIGAAGASTGATGSRPAAPRAAAPAPAPSAGAAPAPAATPRAPRVAPAPAGGPAAPAPAPAAPAPAPVAAPAPAPAPTAPAPAPAAPQAAAAQPNGSPDPSQMTVCALCDPPLEMWVGHYDEHVRAHDALLAGQGAPA